MKVVNALRSIRGLCLAGFAGVGLFPAAAAAVGWGDEKWGEMIWGVGQAPPVPAPSTVPALSTEGLLEKGVTSPVPSPVIRL